MSIVPLCSACCYHAPPFRCVKFGHVFANERVMATGYCEGFELRKEANVGEELKVGDVVVLKSQPLVMMTATSVRTASANGEVVKKVDLAWLDSDCDMHQVAGIPADAVKKVTT